LPPRVAVHEEVTVGNDLPFVLVEAPPDPDHALCDGRSVMPLNALESYLEQMLAIDPVVKLQAPVVTA
jgi:3-deoxy-D-manno-octulosonic acid (KDO) 8-phosphate synthase